MFNLTYRIWITEVTKPYKLLYLQYSLFLEFGEHGSVDPPPLPHKVTNKTGETQSKISSYYNFI